MVRRVCRTRLCTDKLSLLGADEALPGGRYLHWRKIGSCPSDNLLYRISRRRFADVSASEGMCVRCEHKQHSGAGCHQHNAHHVHPSSNFKDVGASPLPSKLSGVPSMLLVGQAHIPRSRLLSGSSIRPNSVAGSQLVTPSLFAGGSLLDRSRITTAVAGQKERPPR